MHLRLLQKYLKISRLLNLGAIKFRKPNVQTLEYHGNEVFLCYTHASPEAKVSLTENINIHAFGCELNVSTGLNQF